MSGKRSPVAICSVMLPILCAALLCGLADRAIAQEVKRPKITGLRVGFDGRYKIGYFAPVEVTLRGGDETLDGMVEVTVPDGDGVGSRFRSGKVHLLAGRTDSVLLYAKVGQTQGEVSVRLHVPGGVAAENTFRVLDGEDSLRAGMSSNQELIVIVGSPIGVDLETTTTPEGEPVKTELVRLPNVAQMPTRWYGYEGVDTLVLTTSNPDIYSQLTPGRLAALDEWVRRGGTLVLCVGKNAPQILKPNEPLADFAPGRLEDMVPLRQSTAIESYADSKSDRLDAQASNAGQEFRLQVPKLADVRGQIEAYEGNRPRDLPLVVRTPRGFGEVVFVALDLDQPPFLRWNARQQLFGKLLGRPRNAPQDTDPNNQGQVTTLGYNDLAGQLRSALDQFSDVRTVPFWQVACGIVLYVLCIGPIDYFLVRRMKRMELTWITFPIWVALFSVVAYVLAYKLKGDQLHINQVDVVDVDLESGLTRGTAWSNIFSPRHDAYNLSVVPQLPAAATAEPEEPPGGDASPPRGKPQALVSWMGLPGNAFSGQNVAGSQAFNAAYSFAPELDALEGMPIAVWSTKGVSTRWSLDGWRPLNSDLQAAADGSLSGRIDSRLDVELADCVLLYNQSAYPIGAMPAGDLIAIAAQELTADAYFKGRLAGIAQLQADAQYNSQYGARYDRSSLNVEPIVVMMMFHNLLGDKSYTGLVDKYQRFLDLSGQLKAGRAVLFGRAKKRVVQLQNDGRPLMGTNDRNWVYYRFILPVKQLTTNN